ncbi:hypothetical protein I5Q41_12240 [Pseudomonas monteilii]|uniref:hypothetical protein n=1 Tax=Pseudomonas TaxID=286 RepID=UPI00048FE719|nr:MULTISPECIES: hypothetical protein [Pseudomonas]MBH3455461.1 hypothetical protein [Pseudomonas monteilii]MBM3110774.1 hypothetical protein [Pseudomonas arcuscaelestis]
MNATITDQLEKFSGPVQRAGHAAERAYKMDKAGTPHTAIAAILTDSSERLGNNHQYTAQGIPTLINLYDDCLSGTPIPAKTANAVITDQQENQGRGSDPLLA